MNDYCPTCRERTGLTARGVCEWCDTPLTAKRGGGRSPGAGCKLTDTQLRALHAAHMRGQSINELAKSIYVQVGYSSRSSCASSISNAWQRLGLQARDRIEMTVLKSFKHGRAGRQQQREHVQRIERVQLDAGPVSEQAEKHHHHQVKAKKQTPPQGVALAVSHPITVRPQAQFNGERGLGVDAHIHRSAFRCIGELQQGAAVI